MKIKRGFKILASVKTVRSCERHNTQKYAIISVANKQIIPIILLIAPTPTVQQVQRMETKSSSQFKQKHHSRNNETKEKLAMSSFRVNSASYYLNSMMKAGISGSALTVNCPIYLTFVHMALLSSFQNLYRLKNNTTDILSEDEQKYLNLLMADFSLTDNPKLNIAVHLFEKGLTTVSAKNND